MTVRWLGRSVACAVAALAVAGCGVGSNQQAIQQGSLRSFAHFVRPGSVSNVAAQSSAATGALAPLTVAQFLHAYRIDELHAQGFTGKGVTVVVPALDSVSDADLEAFAAENGLPDFDYEVIGKPSGMWEGVGELTMDLSIIHAVAPEAKLVVREVLGVSEELIDTMSAQHPGAVWSWSMGLCETQQGGLAEQSAAFQRSAEAGAVHFASSGDSSGYDCFEQDRQKDAPSPDMVGVNFPASEPSVIAVGGTRLWLAKGEYLRETPWYDAATLLGAGGGRSVVFPNRGVPDVAGDADPNTGMLFQFAGQTALAGGTSASAPLWAGLAALLLQAIKTDDPSAQLGPFQPVLQRVAQNHPKAFHDTVVGGIATAKASKGRDDATGWGSPDAVELMAAVRVEVTR